MLHRPYRRNSGSRAGYCARGPSIAPTTSVKPSLPSPSFRHSSEFLAQHYRSRLEPATDARNRLVVHNHRLARSQSPTASNSGEDREDLVQEALLALFQAANRYDHRRGNRFSTHAI